MHPDSSGLIADRYELSDLLGVGGTASVYAATDRLTGEAVAVKVLHQHVAASSGAREALFAEARLAQGIAHLGIAAVRDFGVQASGNGPSGGQRSAAPEVCWVALDLAPGQTLQELVDASGPLSLDVALTIAEAVLRALDAAHELGLVHRDVSPRNVMVSVNEHGEVQADGVRLLDFGLAAVSGLPALAADPTQPGRTGVLGSAHYVSPEHARGESIDPRGDLYQVGGVLHFALTGTPPFPFGEVAAVLQAHVSAPPPAPSARRPGIPRRIDRLVVKAMLKNPDTRFASAVDMAVEVAAARSALGDNVAGGVAGGDGATRVLPSVSTQVPEARTELITAAVTSAVQPRAIPSRTKRRPGGRSGSGPAGGWIAGLVVTALIGSSWALASLAPPATDASEAPAPAPAEPQPSASQAPTRQPTVRPPAQTEPAAASVPALDALMLDEARRTLEHAGLLVGDITIQNSALPGDTVLAFSPGAGSAIPLGGTVSLTVASGSNSVPTVTGLPKDQAVAQVQAAGFAPNLTERADGTATPGSVIVVMPTEQSILRLGSEVTMVVARATANPSPSPTAPSTGGDPNPAPTQGAAEKQPGD
ncbi:PASTA domain-containing protein [Diaminobutyricimonas sp. LJ205]|uniref:protein kinase domain-containing protein n=1 Tax=Diaminobutyricimonas sp. LJ205 TaxID=2683590 RepID=UPI0012F4D8C8|nr:PASTA domain-containing protein [Diaminobutyricimonas sp. LJ205]